MLLERGGILDNSIYYSPGRGGITGNKKEVGHLVLTRKSGQSLVIGEGDNQIVVKLEKVVGDKAILSISAPKDTLVLREELIGKKDKSD